MKKSGKRLKWVKKNYKNSNSRKKILKKLKNCRRTRFGYHQLFRSKKKIELARGLEYIGIIQILTTFRRGLA